MMNHILDIILYQQNKFDNALGQIILILTIKFVKMETTQVKTKNGAFRASLKRNNRQIRDDRAMAIVETAELKYRRKVEDLELKIREMERELENMLDLSPTNAQSLTLASDFDADKYIGKDLEVAVKIRNERIRLDVAKERFEHLFEKEFIEEEA